MVTDGFEDDAQEEKANVAVGGFRSWFRCEGELAGGVEDGLAAFVLFVEVNVCG